MARAEKATAVTEITDALRSSSAIVLTEYRGLTVGQLKGLRRSLSGNATYTVAKNTLTKIAVRGSDIPADEASKIEALLEGPTAIAFVSGDAVTVAKGLRDFSRANPLLVIKGGIFENRAVTPDEIRRLADLESREVLLSKAAGAALAVLQKAISTIAAPLSQMARLAAALQDAAASNPSLLAAGPAPTPAAAEAVEAADAAPAAEDDATVTEAPAEAETDTTADVATEAPADVPADASAEAAPAATNATDSE
ncbi:MAG: large subunit ribosomal protein [Frankiaceae bacterium]|jgi:large subunit ribosomal protein L10|nr:large subunit ribosomal protein [Frankiaceae bacterium]